MYLTDLADVLRAVELTVVETLGWRTRGRRDALHLDGVKSIICHHTAGPSTGDLVVVMPRLGTVSPWASKAMLKGWRICSAPGTLMTSMAATAEAAQASRGSRRESMRCS